MAEGYRIAKDVYSRHDGQVVAIFFDVLGIVIGELDSEHMILDNPKAVQIQNTASGSELKLIDMIGAPEKMSIVKDAIIVYEIKDVKIRNLYLKSATSRQGIFVPAPPISKN